jgi:diguanylate cyclase (GGDEF)-like protein
MDREKGLARTDSLTGALNSRSFYDVAQTEIDRCQRYHRPFALAYIDLDNFKAINDTFGHTTGDEALRTVATFIRQRTRRTDVLARLGGDEFGLLLPETTEQLARNVIGKIQEGLAQEMRRNAWPITFSIGVLSCTTAPPTSDALIKMADELMYSVKREGKNAAKYATCAY